MHLPAYALNELTEVGVHQEALPVRQAHDAVGRRAQLFPIRAALSVLTWPTDKRELWERALARRAVFR